MRTFCPECSPTHQLNHTSEWIGSLMTEIAEQGSGLLSWGPLERLTQWILIGGGLRALRALHLVKQLPLTAESHVHQRTKVIGEEATKRGSKVEILSFLGLPSNLFLLTHKNGQQELFEGLPGIDPVKSKTRMDDKAWAKKFLLKLGAPAAEGKAFWRRSAALAYGQQIGFPLVVKPRAGSLSAHTTVDIRSLAELDRAIRVAQQISPSFVVERYFVGNLYRVTTVGSHVVAVGRRDPPSITGDGVRTVAELVKACEADQRDLLVSLGYKPEEVPSLPKNHLKRAPDEVLPKGERVVVTWKINLSFGATVTDVTSDLHPENRALFEHIARSLNWPSIGFDLIAPDIGISWKDQLCAILELNSLPSIDLHHPPIVRGEVQNVASAILNQAEHALEQRLPKR